MDDARQVDGSLVVPGGFLPVFMLTAGAIGPPDTCSELTTLGGDRISGDCSGGTFGVKDALVLALIVVLVVAPIATTVYLYRRLKAARAAAAV